jgi:hypothetical protein
MGQGGILVPGVLGGGVLARVVLHQGLQRHWGGFVGAQLQHPQHQLQAQLLAGGHAPLAELGGLQQRQRQQLRKQLQGVLLLAWMPRHPQHHQHSLRELQVWT